MNTTTQPGPLEVRLSDQLGLAPERAAFEAWLNPGNHAGNVSPWVNPGRYQKDTHSLAWLAWQAAQSAARTKALQDAARWVDEEMGHAIQDGWSPEAVQSLMATRDMLRAHADMHATTVEVKA